MSSETPFPGWDTAPDETATHWDKYSGKWYRTGQYDYCEAHRGHGAWYRSSHKNTQLRSSRFVQRPSSIDWSQAPEGTTHLYRFGSSEYWMRPSADGWEYWSNVHGRWAADGKPRPEFHIPRPTNLTAPTPTPTEAFTMSAEEAKQLATDKRPMQIVVVVFSNEPNAKEYHYYAPAEAKAGQHAVVYANNGIVQNRDFPFGVVKIVRDNVLDVHGKATKAILASFDEEFAKHVQARMEHMARVKAQLQQKKKQFEENAIFEMLAQNDPEAAALLSELKSFNL